MQLSAIRLKQKNATLYVTALPMKEVLQRGQVDYWREDNPEGYQRPLVEARLRRVANYLVHQEGTFPTSVLLAVRDSDTSKLRFGQEDGRNGIAWGQLTVPDDMRLWVVDGQHRVYGAEHAMKTNPHESAALGEYPVAVVIMVGVDRYAEMLQFFTINTEQKGVPTDVVDRHMVQMKGREGAGIISRISEAAYRRAKATEVSDILRTTPGPWFQRIVIPGERASRTHVRQHAFVASLADVLSDRLIQRYDPGDTARLLLDYWAALQELMPEAFAHADQYVVQRTSGLYALHMIFPDVVAACFDSGDASRDGMKRVLGTIEEGMTSQFWHKDEGDARTIGTSMKSLRALAQHLRDQLPRPVIPGRAGVQDAATV